MFSTGAIILSKRRNRHADDIFEKLLLLQLYHEVGILETFVSFGKLVVDWLVITDSDNDATMYWVMTICVFENI